MRTSLVHQHLTEGDRAADTRAAIALAAAGDHVGAVQLCSRMLDFVPAVLLVRYLDVLGARVTADAVGLEDPESAPVAAHLLAMVKASNPLQKEQATRFFDGMVAEIVGSESEMEARKGSKKAAGIALFLAGSWQDHGMGDLGKAVELWQAAAELDEVAAVYNVAWCTDTGNGMPRCPDDALALYRLAAAQSYPPALNNLGVRYRNGEGVPRDLRRAARLFEEAAARNNLSGMFNLAYSYSTGEGAEKDKAKALALYREAAARGHSSSAYNLALMLAYGDEVHKDCATAWRLMDALAKRGDAEATAAVGRWLMEGECGRAQDVRAGLELVQTSAHSGIGSMEVLLMSVRAK
eukprot:m51a1_g5158 hypothetical protein (351) ;mRNA; r:98648-99780